MLKQRNLFLGQKPRNSPRRIGDNIPVSERRFKLLREERVDEYNRPFSVARISYRPATWGKARAFIVSRRLKDLKGRRVSR